ncbi:spore germination lipoprotein GerD [Virgibacillus siamensis]|uniref:spore germination lipoprotein GerD n=1 Tax=Virgibacillus siamensis TaxID=480071 RepID=UPI0009852087|nr:spore germination lipoprotein GerD [Virgibacillus siamensis]
MKRAICAAFITLLIVVLSACSGESSASKQADYDATKKMVVDILQTEDGKKALKEILSDEKLKKQLVIQSDVVKKSLNEVLTSDKSKEMWTKLFEDPKFVKAYAKAMADEHKKLMKELMNDPEFQKQMLDLMQNPQIDKQMLEVMKSQDFRKHLEKTIQETLQSPLFQAKMTETLLKAAEEQSKQGGKQSQSSGQSGQSGGSGGSGSSGSAGGQ